MANVGYTLMTEQAGPKDLVRWAFFKAGFTDLALVQIGGTEPEQDRFLAAAPELITTLKETAG
jgi:hypothetical protein